MAAKTKKAAWASVALLAIGAAGAGLLWHGAGPQGTATPLGGASGAAAPASQDQPAVPQAQTGEKPRAEVTRLAVRPAELPHEPTAELHAAVKRFKDTTVPLEERRREIAALGQAGDARATQVLMALGSEKTYLNWVAIEALGAIPKDRSSPEVIAYLQGKLSDPDAQVLSAALDSLARQAGEAAISEIAAVMERNRVRGDGFHELVLCAAVAALDLVWSAQAVPVLASELARSDEKGWSLEYGSRVVATLGHRGTPEGRAALGAYAGRLEARKPGDPMAGAYFAQKIAEARAAAR